VLFIAAFGYVQFLEGVLAEGFTTLFSDFLFDLDSQRVTFSRLHYHGLDLSECCTCFLLHNLSDSENRLNIGFISDTHNNPY
jgi:hypothetical protein